MTLIVVGSIVIGCGLCCLACIASASENPDARSAAPLYLLPGVLLLCGAVVLAIVNAAVKALL